MSHHSCKPQAPLYSTTLYKVTEEDGYRAIIQDEFQIHKKIGGYVYGIKSTKLPDVGLPPVWAEIGFKKKLNNARLGMFNAVKNKLEAGWILPAEVQGKPLASVLRTKSEFGVIEGGTPNRPKTQNGAGPNLRLVSSDRAPH